MGVYQSSIKTTLSFYIFLYNIIYLKNENHLELIYKIKKLLTKENISLIKMIYYMN